MVHLPPNIWWLMVNSPIHNPIINLY
jgi:hypothetical protein